MCFLRIDLNNFIGSLIVAEILGFPIIHIVLHGREDDVGEQVILKINHVELAQKGLGLNSSTSEIKAWNGMVRGSRLRRHPVRIGTGKNKEERKRERERAGRREVRHWRVW